MCPNVVYEISEIFGSRRIYKRYAVPKDFRAPNLFACYSLLRSGLTFSLKTVSKP
jgi:hypothetical protein